MALDVAALQVDRSGKTDDWLPPSEAQFRLVTSDNQAYVRNACAAARNAGATSLSVQSEAMQVAMFLSLGAFADNCQAALEALMVTPEDLDRAEERQPAARDRIVIVTGHRADPADRPRPGRFPNSPECIAKARAWLRNALARERAQAIGSISGIGGAASGTDLIFHEVCAELGIPTAVILPIPARDYCRESVADGGANWVERFNTLVAGNAPIVLSDGAELPSWAAAIPYYGVFQRGNIWAMQAAFLRPSTDVTLLALWNGKAGNGPGGTADMIKLATARGAKVCIANTDELFDLDR